MLAYSLQVKVSRFKRKLTLVFMQRATSASMAALVAVALAAVPAAADPVVLNPNFTANDNAANTAFNGGNLFFIQNWSPSGFASNSNTDPGQYDNGSAGAQSVVGFLSGASASLSQVVTGFLAGHTYKVSVGANGRSADGNSPTFRILAGGAQIYGPTALTPVDPLGTFQTAFTSIQSDAFIATDTFVTITFANASTSNANSTTLLTSVSVFDAPEPLSLAILSVGLVGIGLARRRRGAI